LRGKVASLLEIGTGFHPELRDAKTSFSLVRSSACPSRKFDEIIAFAEVEKFLDTPVKRYSNVCSTCLCGAAHLEPEILVVDEVLTVGDAEFQKKCLG
jgi:lipopolysaccharide transport system ATP-binding protein